MRACLERLRGMEARVLVWDDPTYPKPLRHIPDPPPLLFVQGRIPRGPAIAVVGTRRPSPRGRAMARRMAGELAAFAKEAGIDLTIVGPEAPLVDGIVDIFKAEGLTIFGPSAQAAQLEGSKIFMKNFLARHDIPTARYIETDSFEKAAVFIDSLEAPIVVKADGLCAGKVVIIAPSREEAQAPSLPCYQGPSGSQPARIPPRHLARPPPTTTAPQLTDQQAVPTQAQPPPALRGTRL